MLDDPSGMRNYWSADYLAELSDDAIDVFVRHSEAMPVPAPSQSILFPWGGAVAHTGAEVGAREPTVMAPACMPPSTSRQRATRAVARCRLGRNHRISRRRPGPLKGQ